MRVKIGCINIPTSVGQESWRDCFEAASSRSEVFGVNEVLSDSAKRIYSSMSEEKRYGHYGLAQGPNPIFWDRSHYTIGDSGTEDIHGRGPFYSRWPGFNEARQLTWVILRPRGSSEADRDEFMVVNTHWVPNGTKVPNAWRLLVRAQSKRALRKVVRGSMRDGMPCFVVGDMNIYEEFRVIRRFEWIRGVGIDKVGLALPKRLTRGDCSFDMYPAPTDHKRGVAAVARWN